MRLTLWRRVVTAAAVAVIVMLVTPLCAGAATTPVTVLGPTVFALPTSSTAKSTFNIQVLFGVPARTVSVSVVAISTSFGPQPVTGWTVHVRPPRTGTETGTLQVHGPAGVLPDQGTYSVALLAVYGDVRQPITVTAVRQAIALTVPSDQDNTVRLSTPFVDANGSLGTVDIEVDPGAGLQTIQSTQVSVDGGTVTLVPPNSLHSDNGVLSFGVHSSDGLGPGQHTVAVTLRSPQLAAPVSVPLEITVRINRIWIAVIAALGVLAGWIVRVLLVNWRQKAAVERRASDLLRSASALRGQYPDPAFQAVMNDVVQTLTGLIDESDLTKLQAGLDDADTKIKTAQSSYEQNRIDALSALDRLGAIANYGGVVPATVQAVIDAAAQQRTIADGEISARRPTTASRTINAALATARRDLAIATTTWRSAARSSFQTLANDAPTPLSTIATSVLDQLDTHPLQTADTSSPGDLLRAVSQVAVAETDLLSAAGTVAEHAEVAAGTLRQADQSEAAADLDHLANKLRSADDLAAAAAAFMTFSAAAEQDIVAAARLSNADSADKAEMALAAGNYSRAAALLIDARPLNAFTADLADETVVAGGHAAPDSDDSGGAVRQHSVDPTANAGTPGPSPNTGVMPVPVAIASLTLRSRTTLFGARLLDTVISAVVAVAVAYLIFGESWYGTGHDLIQVFLWGFAVNLSAEGLTKLADSAAPTGAP